MWSRSTVAADYPMTHPVEEVVDLIQQVFELEEPPIYRCVAKGEYGSRTGHTCWWYGHASRWVRAEVLMR